MLSFEVVSNHKESRRPIDRRMEKVSVRPTRQGRAASFV
jgi:hypothetical protein